MIRYIPTENDLLVDRLMERVEALDPELALALDKAIGQLLAEYEDRAVVAHGQQILATIEGRGFAQRGNVTTYEENSRWTSVLAAMT